MAAAPALADAPLGSLWTELRRRIDHAVSAEGRVVERQHLRLTRAALDDVASELDAYLDELHEAGLPVAADDLAEHGIGAFEAGVPVGSGMWGAR